MRAADPVHNVELRRNAQGHESVVFAFPYRPDIVDAVRAIPGRRFDWEVEGVVGAAGRRGGAVREGRAGAPSDAQRGPRGQRLAVARRDRVDRPRDRRPAGRQGALHPRHDRRRAGAAARRSWPPTAAGGCGCPSRRRSPTPLLNTKGARLDPRALRCASRLQVDQVPAPAALILVEGYGEPRFRLDINWDPDTLPAFLALPACEAHGRTVPVDPYLLEPLEHYLRTYGVEPAHNAAEVLERLRREHDGAIDDVRRSRASSAPAAGGRGPARRRAEALPARRRRVRAARRGAPSWPTSRASARRSRRSRRWRPTTRSRRWSSAPPA